MGQIHNSGSHLTFEHDIFPLVEAFFPRFLELMKELGLLSSLCWRIIPRIALTFHLCSF